jgi:hypothetical protein
MNRKFWNIFPRTSDQFSGQIPVEIAPISIGKNTENSDEFVTLKKVFNGRLAAPGLKL